MGDLPKGVSYDQEGDIFFRCITEDIVGFKLDRFTGRDDHFSTIELFLP